VYISPIPLLPPVTTAVFPDRSNRSIYHLSWAILS
jgi:hypothetical protein